MNAMNAKELIEAATPSSVLIAAAEDLKSRARQGGSQPTMTSDLWLAQHILSTARPDDDEPVTRERLEADGWFRRSIRYRHWESQISVIEQHPEFIAEFETEQALCRLKSMGHLRRLVAALGE